MLEGMDLKQFIILQKDKLEAVWAHVYLPLPNSFLEFIKATQ